MKTCSCTESETTSEWNWKVIGDGEAGRRGARWHKVTFTLDTDILALKGLNFLSYSFFYKLYITSSCFYFLVLSAEGVDAKDANGTDPINLIFSSIRINWI